MSNPTEDVGTDELLELAKRAEHSAEVAIHHAFKDDHWGSPPRIVDAAAYLIVAQHLRSRAATREDER